MAWLDDEGKAFWLEHAPRVAARGWLKPEYLAEWAAMCETWSRYRRATKVLPKRISPKVFPPAYAIQRQALVQLLHFFNRFGMDPASAHRLRTTSGEPLDDPVPLSAGGASETSRDAEWLRRYEPATGA